MYQEVLLEKKALESMQRSLMAGGQPFSIANMREVRKVCDENGLMIVFDVSLLAENIYFSGRKISCTRGGGRARARTFCRALAQSRR